MNAAAYFQAAIPDPYIIFGVRLLPLSITRYRILRRFGCAFVGEEETSASFEDLILGIMVCGMTVKDFFESLQGSEFEAELHKLGERIRAEIHADQHFNLLEKYGLFQSFIKESSRIPNYWNEHDDLPLSPSHWSHNLEITLREIGYTSEEIDEGPLSKALADYFKHAENEGAIRLISEEELLQGEANENLFAEMAKGGKWPGSN